MSLLFALFRWNFGRKKKKDEREKKINSVCRVAQSRRPTQTKTLKRNQYSNFFLFSFIFPLLFLRNTHSWYTKLIDSIILIEPFCLTIELFCSAQSPQNCWHKWKNTFVYLFFWLYCCTFHYVLSDFDFSISALRLRFIFIFVASPELLPFRNHHFTDGRGRWRTVGFFFVFDYL